ncbi:carboxymuconolactone decarboxylase family protein [Neorhizobium sp. P12A]|uniref:carboxymuconolactone decarboxylase family protein n=1 Tax=Neorhizobium sp. P12A TaxID=2268027 RepID=UPI0011ED49AF|nr:carboxymuconolactone decarboxylase family protein [Neorhizobium sp. P12A]KAA0678478.1 carboxymuconolactone decarboxylase family protein [Neorhizobium sp. P12A]
MASISYVSDSIYQSRLGSSQTANLLRVLFHSPDWAQVFVRLAGAQMSVLSLAARDRELVILQAGYMLDAAYVVAQHEGISEILGVSQAQRDALRENRFNDEVFTDREKALVRLVASLIDRSYPNDATLAEASRHFSEAELVEIVGVQGFAATVAAITRTFDVDIDPVSGEDLLRFSKRVTDLRQGSL